MYAAGYTLVQLIMGLISCLSILGEGFECLEQTHCFVLFKHACICENNFGSLEWGLYDLRIDGFILHFELTYFPLKVKEIKVQIPTNAIIDYSSLHLKGKPNFSHRHDPGYSPCLVHSLSFV